MDIINTLFEAMRVDLDVMAEHNDSERDLLNELNTATPEILAEYKKIFID
jgi:hypothetical protein